MFRALDDDYETMRNSLLQYGLELTLAAELLACKSGLCERNAAETASRCLAITRLAALLGSSGLELPETSESLEEAWRQDRSCNRLHLAG
jgi:hypothetical protein